MTEQTLSYAGGGATDDRFRAPYLCLAFECEQPLASPVRLSIAEVDEVEIGRGERAVRREASAAGARLVVQVADGWMSSRHARLVRAPAEAGGGWRVVDLGSKNGTFVGGERIAEAALVDGDLVEIGSTLFLFRDAVERSYREPPDVDGASVGGDPAFATLCLPWSRALAELARVAISRVPLVLHGETGTGKEILARSIHRRSSRGGAYVAINCGALPETLIEGELFGHRKGAFSGATDERPGLVRAAHGGTLFLDEIAELPLASQVKLLRVLQEGEVVPLGGTTPLPVDLRVVCASHRALPDEVAAGRFRADLYARLAGHVVELPPLRERREDLGMIVGALLRRLVGDEAGAVRFERDAARALFRHRWPLNVRELEQALGAALALSPAGADRRIALAHLPEAVRGAGARAAEEGDAELRADLVRRFTAHRGNLSAVARELGKERVQIRRWCRRLGIDPERFR